MKVAIGIIDIPGVNQAYNIPTPAQQEDWYGLVIKAINSEGGIACRQVDPTFYNVNETDSNNLQQNCLNIAASKPFAYLDDGAYLLASQKDCFPQAKIPYIGPSGATREELQQDYPYMLLEGGDISLGIRNAFQAFAHQGVYTAARFKKEGVIYRDCTSTTLSDTIQQLNLAGVSSSKIITYNIGCPSAPDSPSDLLQAILKFKQAGVTNVAPMDMVGDFPNFTNLAQQQGFDPLYGMPDYGYIATSGPTAQKPNSSNINNAELVTDAEYGFQPVATASTTWCNNIYVRAGQPPIFKQGAGLGGVICNALILLRDAADSAVALQRNALASGIESYGKVDFSYPTGPANYSGDHVVSGGQFWLAVRYSDSCTCWSPLESSWQPAYS